MSSACWLQMTVWGKPLGPCMLPVTVKVTAPHGFLANDPHQYNLSKAAGDTKLIRIYINLRMLASRQFPSKISIEFLNVLTWISHISRLLQALIEP